MFSILISLIAILLVAALVVVSVFYGGQVWQSSRLDAEASRYINEAQQITGAVRLYVSDNAGQFPRHPTELVEHSYLRELPRGGEEWAFYSDALTRQMVDNEICRRVNERVGIGAVLPTCGSADVQPNWTIYCCTAEYDNDAI